MQVQNKGVSLHHERQTNNPLEKLKNMKATVNFAENSPISKNFIIEGLGLCTIHLFEIPFKIAKNCYTAATYFKKGEIVKVKFLTLYENGKRYYTPIDNDFELIALNNTIVETEDMHYLGDRPTHSTDFEFDVEKIKSELFSYQRMTPSEADAFDAFEEGENR